MEACAKKQEVQDAKMERSLLGKNLRLVQRVHCSVWTKKLRSKGRMDAENRWWVAELLVADCETAWIHPGWEDII